MKDIVIVGFGGHAKSLADCIERSGRYKIVGYTDSSDNNVDYPYLGTDDSLKDIFDNGTHCAAIGVGYLGKGCVRENIYRSLKEIGFELPVVRDPSAIISESAAVGEGTFIGKNVVVNAQAVVGNSCILNTGSIIEHECIVKDFAHIAVGAVVCGQASVGRAAFVGANATIIQCMNIGDNEIVPAGAVIR